MTQHYQNAQQAIQAEATAWVLRLDEQTLDQPTRGQLLAWLKTSPQHIDEFLLASALWRELDNIDAERRTDVDQLLAEATDNIVALKSASSPIREPADTDDVLVHLGAVSEMTRGATKEDRRTPAKYRKSVALLAGLAASILLVAFVSFSLRQDPTQHYQTGVGQQTLFTLEDGSIVYLNTQSSLTVRMTENARELDLAEGEAMFEVAKDPARPFRVTSGSVVIEAIGTQFNVYRRYDGVHVTVIEGEVKVESTSVSSLEAIIEPVRLVAGEEAHSDQSGEVARVAVPDLEKSTAWREQRLVFRDDSLETVAAEFNRYNRQQIIIDASPDPTRRVTATFDAHDSDSFIAFLERDPRLVLLRNNNTIHVKLANR